MRDVKDYWQTARPLINSPILSDVNITPLRRWIFLANRYTSRGVRMAQGISGAIDAD